jgi:uncharacterized Zn finger protein
MPQEKLPRLTEAQISQLASPQSFQRGRQYFRDKAIIEPMIQGKELQAQCEGSDYEPYEVRATLGKNGVTGTSCDCPYDYGGICKHIVALLLTYVHAPQSFHRVAAVSNSLQELSREELLDMVSSLVQSQPKLAAQIEMLSGATKPGKAVNVAAYRSQVRRAVRSESLRTLQKELKSLRDMAARQAKADDWLKAGAIYHVTLDEAVKGYNHLVQSMDENGDICVLLEELAKGLSQCLKNAEADAKTRRVWLETLLEAELTDIQIGGIDLAPSAGETVLKQSTNEEWAWIEERLRKEIPHKDSWARQAIVGFLTAGQEKHGAKKRVADTIRELGTTEQKTHLLIEEGKTAEALLAVRKIIAGKPGLVTEFADSLLKAGAKQDALTLVMENGGDYWRAREWIARYYRSHGSPQEAVEAQQKVFLSSPDIFHFAELKKISVKTKNWEEVRQKVTEELEQKKNFRMLIEIALAEKDVLSALELLPQLSKSSDLLTVRESVARSAAREHPKPALVIYQQMAEIAVEGRNRPSYVRSVGYLKQGKKLALQIQKENEFTGFVEKLRKKYANLSAFQEELQKAKL